MKTRKMKERRNYYRAEKDSYKAKVSEMQKDNEALYSQIEQMQEQSKVVSKENAKLVDKLAKIEDELQMANTDLNKA